MFSYLRVSYSTEPIAVIRGETVVCITVKIFTFEITDSFVGLTTSAILIVVSNPTPSVFSTSCIPQIGHLPRASLTICGCMEQVYIFFATVFSCPSFFDFLSLHPFKRRNEKNIVVTKNNILKIFLTMVFILSLFNFFFITDLNL